MKKSESKSRKQLGNKKKYVWANPVFCRAATVTHDVKSHSLTMQMPVSGSDMDLLAER